MWTHVELSSISAENEHRQKKASKSAVLDTTISHCEWHEYFNCLANSPLPIHTSCKGPNTATHDQEVDKNQATEDTQLEASYRLCNHRGGSCVHNQETKIKKGSRHRWCTSGSIKILYWQNVWYPECNLQVYESNTFPQEWGSSTITPVYKSEDRNTLGNYWGITIQLVESIISELYSSYND